MNRLSHNAAELWKAEANQSQVFPGDSSAQGFWSARLRGSVCCCKSGERLRTLPQLWVFPGKIEFLKIRMTEAKALGALPDHSSVKLEAPGGKPTGFRSSLGIVQTLIQGSLPIL